MTTVLGLGSILLYLTATVLLGLRLASGPDARNLLRGGLAGAAVVAVCLHGVLLYHAMVTEAGLNFGFSNAASLTTWVIVLFLLVAALMEPVEDLGLLVLPLAALAVALSLAWPDRQLLPGRLTVGVQTHIVLSILAYSVLAIAACQSVVLAYQDRRLRRKRPDGLMLRLPALQTQESLLFQLIGFGFFLLSLSLVSGMMFVEDMFAQHLVHKTVLSIVAWVVFGVLLWGRWRFGWRGRTAIGWSLGGFFTLMLAYFGTKLVLEVILGRSWYV
ncbi:MAG: hypothetical protein GWN84_18115 [Gammaproteobacteria bacterium]|nr:hypothetical protein [Gammaproteobacteria bacterium]NIR84755.1 hypothetical protein [Gammaproteobacteria bacterium]NIR91251.1 hypothetical protein [Gammaproteobacteria bacterium]NIU05798.1 hypothetical protein [Gammaproteobacteria bacterium]NIV52917.1 hypothetical protein [Gammaproteobacteria bacterium]